MQVKVKFLSKGEQVYECDIDVSKTIIGEIVANCAKNVDIDVSTHFFATHDELLLGRDVSFLCMADELDTTMHCGDNILLINIINTHLPDNISKSIGALFEKVCDIQERILSTILTVPEEGMMRKDIKDVYCLQELLTMFYQRIAEYFNQS